MTTARRRERTRPTILGLPADAAAVRRFRMLDTESQGSLMAVVQATEEVATKHGAKLRIAWDIDPEVEGWEEFIVVAVGSFDLDREMTLIDELAAAYGRVLVGASQSCRAWLSSAVGIDVSAEPLS